MSDLPLPQRERALFAVQEHQKWAGRGSADANLSVGLHGLLEDSACVLSPVSFDLRSELSVRQARTALDYAVTQLLQAVALHMHPSRFYQSHTCRTSTSFGMLMSEQS